MPLRYTVEDIDLGEGVLIRRGRPRPAQAP